MRHHHEPLWSQIDALSGRLTVLQALLANTFGESFDAFTSMGNELQDAYKCHCCDLARECAEEASRLAQISAADAIVRAKV